MVAKICATQTHYETEAEARKHLKDRWDAARILGVPFRCNCGAGWRVRRMT